jgi:MoaA/NifB/PqqE/SkfB family radical SAM enzyme
VNYDLPRQGIMVENTILCNLECISCCNQVATGQRVGKIMSLEEVKKISTMIKEHKITRLAYFKLGEPFLSPRLNEELAIIRADNPELEITVSTNGVLVNTDRKRDAAMMMDIVSFSIDGIDDATVTKYQVGSNFEKAYKNLADMVTYRNRLNRKKPWLEWKYVLFNWNDRPEMIHKAIEMARKIGVDSISFWPTLSPLRGISWRYYLGRFFKSIGEPSWKGREVFFDGGSPKPPEPEPEPLAKQVEMQRA